MRPSGRLVKPDEDDPRSPRPKPVAYPVQVCDASSLRPCVPILVPGGCCPRLWRNTSSQGRAGSDTKTPGSGCVVQEGQKSRGGRWVRSGVLCSVSGMQVHMVGSSRQGFWVATPPKKHTDGEDSGPTCSRESHELWPGHTFDQTQTNTSKRPPV